MNEGTLAVLHPESLDANRTGYLTDLQKQGLRSYDRSRRKGVLGFVPILTIIGILLLTAKGPARNAWARPYAGMAFLAGAAIALILALGAHDTLAEDVQMGRVESVEGAIGKDRYYTHSGNSSSTSYYLDVAGTRFTVARETYHAAPDAGIVRLYYLPRSRKVVNLERMPDRPLPAGILDSPVDALKILPKALKFWNPVEANEARATIAAMESAFQVEHASEAAPPPLSERDPRPLAEAIIGRWKSGPMVLDFSSDGTARLVLLGGHERQGHWSVDAYGKLHADATGKEQIGDAWVVGDSLTISTDGSALTFRRA